MDITKEKNITCLGSIDNKDIFNYYCAYNFDNWKPPIERVSWVESQITGKNISLIDIGCGAYPVSSNIQATYKVGVDISLPAARKVQELFNEIYLFDLITLTKDQIPNLINKFDYVIMSETLEHFENIFDIMVKLQWFLKPDGKIILTYPNHYSISMLLDYITHGFNYLRYKDFMEGHLTFYSKKQLDLVFDIAGYGIRSFDARPCDIIPNRFPNETNQFWKFIAKIFPHRFAHQFLYVLVKDIEPKYLPNRFKVTRDKGVRVVKGVSQITDYTPELAKISSSTKEV